MTESRIQTPSFTCQVCWATFRRLEHLKRHASTHYEGRSHKCSFCGSTYQRRDVLRRHWKSCPKRSESSQEVPPPLKGGKKKRSCDGCATLKRSCNRGQPCQTCAYRKSPCTYTCTSGDIEQRDSDTFDGIRCENPQDFLASSSDCTFSFDDCFVLQASDGYVQDSPIWQTSLQVPYQDDMHEGVFFPGISIGEALSLASDKVPLRFDFLLNFTQVHGVNNAYNFGRTFGKTTPAYDSPEISTEKCHAQTIDRREEREVSESSQSSSWHRNNIDLNGSTFSNSSPNIYSGYGNSLLIKLAEVHEGFMSIPGDASTKDGRTQSTFEKLVTGFFCPAAVQRFLDFFWERWNPHCPIVHKPTFCAEKTHPILLMTMALMGACASSVQRDNQMARSLLDLAEDVVFQNDLFRTGTGVGDEIEKIKILQGTYFLCILQKWEGNDAAKRRIRQQRFPTYIAATRALGISRATHGDVTLTSSFGEAEWRAYICREEMIRTVNYVFMLDSSFLIFHNSPPRLMLQEMEIDLTCPERCFQAKSANEFILEMVLHSAPRHRRPLLTEVIRELCREEQGEHTSSLLFGASTLNLFSVITALHSLVFHQRMSSITLPFATTPLYIALNNWTKAWKYKVESAAIDLQPDAPWKEEGFIQHADEFALLARVHLDHAIFVGYQPPDVAVTLPPISAQKGCDGLLSLDETSMGQVRELMLMFDTLNIV